MIISASYKTDIPAFYGPWFMNRLRAGYCRMVNPYGGQVSTVPLDREAVDGFVFWTRNAGAFLDPLNEVAERGFPFIIHMTVTGYPRALDFATIGTDRAVEQMGEIAARFGPRAVVWRYDPIVLSSLTPPDWHRGNFTRIAAALEGAVDEAVVSFAQVYRKTARNMAAAARAFHFEWSDPPAPEKQTLLADLLPIARRHGMALSLCAQPDLLVAGVMDAACVDAGRLSDVGGAKIAARRKPHRNDCGCWESRDIGAYDTCPHGCAYCYAVQNRTLAKRRFQAHDPDGEFLFPPKGA